MSKKQTKSQLQTEYVAQSAELQEQSKMLKEALRLESAQNEQIKRVTAERDGVRERLASVLADLQTACEERTHFANDNARLKEEIVSVRRDIADVRAFNEELKRVMNQPAKQNPTLWQLCALWFTDKWQRIKEHIYAD